VELAQITDSADRLRRRLCN